MKKPHRPLPSAGEFRKLAEERLRAAPPMPVDHDEAQRLLHEMRVHQIELELQNEELLRRCATMKANSEKHAAPHAIVEHTRDAGEIRRLLAEAECNRLSLLKTIEELTRSEADLRAREADMAEAQRIGHFGNWELDLTGGNQAGTSPLNWSDEVFRIFGIEPSAFGASYEAFLAAVHPADRERMEEAQRRVLSGEGNLNFEHRIVQPDGTVRWVRELAELKRDDSGRVTRLAGTVLDITERKQSELDLFASESHLRAIFENEPECVKMVSLDGILLEMNPAGLRLIEASDAMEVIGKPVLGLILPEDRTVFMDLHTRVTRGETGQAQFRITGLKGTGRWMESHSAPLRAADGTVTSVLSVTRDVTHSKKAADILSASEARFRALFDQAAVGMCLVSTEGDFLRTNRRFCEIVGYSAEELLARTCVETTHPDDRAREAVIIQRMLAGELSSDNWEKRYVHQDGRVIWCNLTLAFIPGEARDARQFVGVIEDITERRQAAEERDRMFNLSVDLLSVATFEGGLEQVNPAWTRCLGWSVEELTSRPWLSFVHPDDHEATRAAGAALLRGEGVHEFENRYRCKNGTYRWLSWNSHPLPETRQIFGVCRDVTEHRIASDQLRRGEELLRIAGNIAQLGGWTVELPDVRVTWSDEVCAMHGMPSGTVPALEDALGFYTPASRVTIEAAFSACVWDGIPFDLELEIVNARGQIREVRATGLAIRQADGTIQRVQGALQDITEQKLTRRKLQQGLSLLRIAGAIAKVGGWSISIPDNELYWSDEIFEIVDWPPGPVPTLEQALELYPEPWRAQLGEAIRLCATRGIPFELDLMIKTAKGQLFWARCKAEAVRAADGRVTQVQGAFQDVSEQVQDIHDLKVAQLEINRSNRALKMLSTCNEALVRAETEAGLLAAFCRHSREIGGYRMAWIGYAQDDAARTISIVSQSGDESGYLDTVRVSWNETAVNGQGPAGQVIRSGRPVICADFELDDRFAPWRDVARQHGLRSVICLPLRQDDKTFGLLGLYSSEVNDPGTDEVKLLQELADDLAFGIGNLRAQQERRRLEAAVMKVATSVSASVSADFLTDLAVSVAEALEAQGAFVARLLPGEQLAARTVAAVVDGKVVENFEYILRGTPCENLAGGNDCVVPANVAEHFPDSPSLAALGAQAYVGRSLVNAAGQPLGLIFVLFREPLKDSGFIVSTLQIFATRAAAEFERLEADSRLLEQASLLDKARDAILVLDLDQTIRFWNQSAERFYGWKAEEALGRSAIDLLYRNTKAYLAAIETTLSSGEWQGELQQYTKSGITLMVEARWTLVNDEKGQPSSILTISTDITERKNLEQQFLRAQRMESIGTLAGGIAHDLNNVLAPIMMAIELLKMQENDARKLDILNTIETSSKRGADMVKQVLSFARGVEGQQLEVQAAHLLNEIEKLANETFLKNIEVTSDVPGNLWTVQGDPTQLHQVLLNLCVNARDAMPYGGTLSLAASNLMLDEHYAGMNIEARPGPYLRIAVEDTGTGMPPGVIDRIFEPFFTTKEQGKGTGLGLSTTTAIIKSHGGFIRAYSETGVGTRFHVYLPAQTESGIASTEHVKAELPCGQGQLILVIDDEAAIRQITQQTLEAFGYRVVLASDGAEAVAIYGVRHEEIAAVLTDMMMPVMDGPATIQVLIRMNPEVRIIAASGLNANGMVAKAANVGVKHFIPKPYTAETLLKTLHSVLHP